mmetsp:Transcript_73271/g.129160  ORF Transcript_73271/g.129160 Transcript_73271/m.129160 type:complete len:100 (+) Transcript_73271:157-456(+)
MPGTYAATPSGGTRNVERMFTGLELLSTMSHTISSDMDSRCMARLGGNVRMRPDILTDQSKINTSTAIHNNQEQWVIRVSIVPPPLLRLLVPFWGPDDT